MIVKLKNIIYIKSTKCCKNLNKKLIILKLLFFVNSFNLYYLKKNTFNEKVCICTVGKKENKYILEYVEHYKKYGVDKIYLYDNNDIDGEHFESVINDYIQEGFVELLNWRGKETVIRGAMNDCYKRNNKSYDWLIYYELDEFIHLSNYSNIKHFLHEKKFNKCHIIHLNLLIHNDNNQLYYENKSLFERFPKIVPKELVPMLQVKMIIKGGINDLQIISTALSTSNISLKFCNGFGDYSKIFMWYTKVTDYKYYYVDHFFSKSTEEFITKLAKGDGFAKGKALEDYKIYRIKRYFQYNDFSLKKLEYMEKGLNLNLSQFKNWKGLKWEIFQ